MIGRTALHYLAVIFGVSAPQTQTTQAEREMLCKFIPGRKHIVEVGVFEGFTTRLLATAADADAVVYGVDPFFSGRLGISWGELIAIAYNRRNIKNGKTRIIRKFSTEVTNEAPQVIDYVFIDADHSLAGISADWAFWGARLTSGGIIALHDTVVSPNSPNELGSHQYFGSHIQHDPAFEIVGQQDCLSVLRKR